ncbi:MAG: preprotein translocase subunit SecG [Rhodothermales bacterium]|nr:preprotein translocase subunit SecG [Rhodothermales bacterium]
MYTFLIILIAIIAVLMTFVVLLQSGRGGGLAGIASGGTQQMLGARQAPDVLEKATWTMAGLFIVLCVLSNFLIDQGETRNSVLQQRAQGQQTEQAVPVLPPPTPATEAPATEAAPAGEVNN